MAKVYKLNHKPRHFYNEDIRDFNQRDDLPDELFNLDLLDGSPPCSSFSVTGNREKDWGKEKKFTEGQKLQRLDDLVFEYLKTIEKLSPKVALLENVKGLIIGNAKAYANQIFHEFTDLGYRVQIFLLNSSKMGIPQKRERVFFVGLKNDYDLPKLELKFSEPLIPFRLVSDDEDKSCDLSDTFNKYWKNAKQGKRLGSFGSNQKTKWNDAAFTIISGANNYHPKIPRELNELELKRIGSYPIDYNFAGLKPLYLIGMSVPPVMTAQIAHQIYLQWLSKIN